jgi:hypothetical protein
MSEHLISEHIKTITETADTSRMAIREPGCLVSLYGGVELLPCGSCYDFGEKMGSVVMAARRCIFVSIGTEWPRNQTAPCSSISKGSLPLSVSHIYPNLAAGPFTDRLTRRAADYFSDALYPDKAYCRKNLSLMRWGLFENG